MNLAMAIFDNLLAMSFNFDQIFDKFKISSVLKIYTKNLFQNLKVLFEIMAKFDRV